MLTIKVWCLPTTAKEHLHRLVAGFDNILLNFEKTLGINRNDKVYLFPTDLMTTGLGDEILIEVNGLPLAQRTARVTRELEKFAIALMVEVTNLYPDAYVVSRLEPYHPDVIEWTNQSRD